jgi:hypothetical protein
MVRAKVAEFLPWLNNKNPEPPMLLTLEWSDEEFNGPELPQTVTSLHA